MTFFTLGRYLDTLLASVKLGQTVRLKRTLALKSRYFGDIGKVTEILSDERIVIGCGNDSVEVSLDCIAQEID